MKVAIYARVSTDDQNCALQLEALRAHCKRWEFQITKEYVDSGFSGKAASRPALDELLADARERRFEAVIVWKIDRFGRSVKNFTQHLCLLDSYGVGFVSMSEPIDTRKSSPMADLLMHILIAFAQFERSMIVERVKSGMAAAKHKGIRCGRPKAVVDRSRLRTLHAQGFSLREIGRKVHVSYATVARLLAEPVTPAKRRRAG
jgi:DNA invertase Pin-like site-specific DNA recombinase